MTILAAALLSGCVTREETADRDSARANRDNTVLLVPVFVLPPESGGERSAPNNAPPGRSGKDTQAQWIRVPVRTGATETVLFPANQTGIHFVAIPLTGVQTRSIATTRIERP